MLAALNLLAFAIHTVCDCLEQIWVEARTAKRARTRFFAGSRMSFRWCAVPETEHRSCPSLKDGQSRPACVCFPSPNGLM
jgi:hypothetical protein